MIWQNKHIENYADLVFCFNYMAEDQGSYRKLWSLFELLCPDARTVLGMVLAQIHKEPSEYLQQVTGVNPMVFPNPKEFDNYPIEWVNNPTVERYFDLPELEWNPKNELYLYSSDGPKKFAGTAWYKTPFNRLLFCQKRNSLADVVDELAESSGWFLSRFGNAPELEPQFGLADENLYRVSFENSVYPISTKPVIVRAEIGERAISRGIAIDYPTGAKPQLIEFFILSQIAKAQKKLARELASRITVSVIDGE